MKKKKKVRAPQTAKSQFKIQRKTEMIARRVPRRRVMEVKQDIRAVRRPKVCV